MSKQLESLSALRNMDADDLAHHLGTQRRRLFEVRFQQATGQVENHRQIRDIRREIARTLTLQIELARGQALAPPAPPVSDTEPRTRPRRRRLRGRVEENAETEPEETVDATSSDTTEVEATADAEAPAARAKPRKSTKRTAKALEVDKPPADEADADDNQQGSDVKEDTEK